jgi:hypothetical protein
MLQQVLKIERLQRTELYEMNHGKEMCTDGQDLQREGGVDNGQIIRGLSCRGTCLLVNLQRNERVEATMPSMKEHRRYNKDMDSVIGGVEWTFRACPDYQSPHGSRIAADMVEFPSRPCGELRHRCVRLLNCRLS